MARCFYIEFLVGPPHWKERFSGCSARRLRKNLQGCNCLFPERANPVHSRPGFHGYPSYPYPHHPRPTPESRRQKMLILGWVFSRVKPRPRPQPEGTDFECIQISLPPSIALSPPPSLSRVVGLERVRCCGREVWRRRAISSAKRRS